jgi:hypothetical protein
MRFNQEISMKTKVKSGQKLVDPTKASAVARGAAPNSPVQRVGTELDVKALRTVGGGGGLPVGRI